MDADAVGNPSGPAPISRNVKLMQHSTKSLQNMNNQANPKKVEDVMKVPAITIYKHEPFLLTEMRRLRHGDMAMEGLVAALRTPQFPGVLQGACLVRRNSMPAGMLETVSAV